MGVKHFWPWLRNNYAEHIRTLRIRDCNANVSVDTLAIDMNGLIHQSAQKIYQYGNFEPRKGTKRHMHRRNRDRLVFDDVAKTVDFLRKSVNPKKRLLLCVDGVAGLSKMSQQRQRRFRSEKDMASKEEPPIFDSNCITPGTVFLDRLCSYLDWYVQVQISCNPDWLNMEVIISNEKVAGEGEHKIIRYLRNRREVGESCCIHGMDADLVMLALGSPCLDIHIYREDSFNRDIFHMIDVGQIRNKMRKRLDVSDKNQRVINDFILMCYCVGNDFLPQVPGVEILQGGIDSMTMVYQEGIDENDPYLTRRHQGMYILSKKNMGNFLSRFAELEEELINEKLSKKESFFPDELLEQNSIFVTGTGLQVNMTSYKEAYYAKKFPKGTTPKDVCIAYLTGMQWVLNYYLNGIPSWTWCYPYSYGPFLSDLVLTIRSNPKIPKFPPSEPVNTFQQLMLVLPSASADKLLPPPIASRMRPDGFLGSYFPATFDIDLSGKRKEWEGLILLPRVDVAAFTKEYQSAISNISPRDLKRNRPGQTFVYIRNNEHTYPIKSYYGNLDQNFCKRKFFTLERPDSVRKDTRITKTKQSNQQMNDRSPESRSSLFLPVPPSQIQPIPPPRLNMEY